MAAGTNENEVAGVLPVLLFEYLSAVVRSSRSLFFFYPGSQRLLAVVSWSEHALKEVWSSVKDVYR